MDQQFSAHLVIGMVMSHVAEWLKTRSWFPLLDLQHASWVNRSTVVVIAFLTALGIHWVAVWNADGVLTITIHGLSAQTLREHGWDWLQQFMLMHGYYHGVIVPGKAKS